MPDATSANPDTNADNQSLLPMRPSTNYLCTSCQVSFPNGQEQRTHMKEPWHLCNIKRRIASLPPIPLDVFISQNEKKTGKKTVIKEASTNSSDEEGSDNDGEESSDNDDEESPGNDEESTSPFQCLFCNQAFANDDAGLATNLEHMRNTHSFFIPFREKLVDMQSFIGYLATEIRVWHECLYCGATKSSKFSIQCHMMDKNHCLLNLDREPELRDFWDDLPEYIITEPESPYVLGGESGRKSIDERTMKKMLKLVARAMEVATPEESEKLDIATTASNSEGETMSLLASLLERAWDLQWTPHAERSLAGVPKQQRMALVLAEKKAQRSEAVSRRAREWANSKGANSQKFDQLNTKSKMGRQNHKLMPR